MRGIYSILFAFMSATLAIAQPQAPNAQTREFPELKCRYTLPGEDWKWQEPAPNSLFVAKNELGFVLSFHCGQIMGRDSMDQSAAANFEQGLVRTFNGQLRKRAQRFIVFQGLQCYQFEGVFADGRTMAVRVFVANQLAYSIALTGGKEPVEQFVDFEKIMSGFQFTEPPLIAKPNETGHDGFYYLGNAIFWFGLLALYNRYRRGSRKKKTPVARPIDDEFEEPPPIMRTAIPGHTGLTTARLLEPLPREPVNDAPLSFDHERPVDRDSELPKGTGSCRHCGHSPIAYGANECPRCAGSDPNPGVVSRLAGRIAWTGAIAGALGGATWGYFAIGDGPVGAFAGFMLGTFAGLVLGLVGGLTIGLTARIVGIR